MTETYGFDHYLPSGQPCYVEAEIEPFVQAHINCLPEDAYPAEGGYAEITSVTVSGEALGDERPPSVEVDMSEVWIRTKGQKFDLFLDDLAETAYETWLDDQ